MTRAAVQTMKRAWLFALLAWGIVAAPVRADGPSLQVYCWQGKGTGSNLLNKQFTPKWKAVLNDGKGATIAIDDHPSPEQILERIGKANVVYTNSHSGVPKGGNEQGLQVGDKGSGHYVLLARELAAAKPTRPQLVVINGCSTMPLLPETDGKVRNLATGFGITPGTKGRAYIGFEDVHSGAKGDDYFRVFFYFWSGVGNKGERPTLKQAVTLAKDYIEDQVKKLGGDEAQRFLLSNAAANVAKDLHIVGDEDLRYTDLKP